MKYARIEQLRHLGDRGVLRVQPPFQRLRPLHLFIDQREGLNGAERRGIPAAVHYPVPPNEQPAYKHLCCPNCTPVTKPIAKQVMGLPMGTDITKVQKHQVVSEVIGLRPQGVWKKHALIMPPM